MLRIIFCIVMFLSSFTTKAQENGPPLRVAVIGLSHSHVHWILNRQNDGDFEIVGVYEQDEALAARLFKQYKMAPSLLYQDLELMLDETRPEAATAFNMIFEHLEAMEACAPRGVHLMVEKPLAANLKHARAMEELAQKHKVHLLTNYETTWYPTNHLAYELAVEQEALGAIRKIVVRDGHPGPKEIGVNEEFLDWLTDPVKNGGGAVTDFGCYGANLMTWLMQGQKPLSVMALLQQHKPDIYPKVDDEATIMLEYPSAQGIIHASWNWPINRKDMEVYGKTGYVYADNRSKIRIRMSEEQKEEEQLLEARKSPLDDPFKWLRAVVREEISLDRMDLGSLENNMIVMEILDAAIKSARKGKRIELK